MLDDDYYKMMRKQYHNDSWEQKIKKTVTTNHQSFSELHKTHGREDAEMLQLEKQNSR